MLENLSKTARAAPLISVFFVCLECYGKPLLKQSWLLFHYFFAFLHTDISRVPDHKQGIGVYNPYRVHITQLTPQDLPDPLQVLGGCSCPGGLFMVPICLGDPQVLVAVFKLYNVTFQ